MKVGWIWVWEGICRVKEGCRVRVRCGGVYLGCKEVDLSVGKLGFWLGKLRMWLVGVRC